MTNGSKGNEAVTRRDLGSSLSDRQGGACVCIEVDFNAYTHGMRILI